MSDFYISLKNKYNYSDDFMIVLQRVIDALIKYYGESFRKRILSMMLDVNIHVKESFEDSNLYISEFLGVYENHLPYDTIFGYATTRPFYKNGVINSKSIIYLTEKIDVDDVMSYSVLVHELCHFVKQTPFYVSRDKIYGGTGLQTEVYNFDGCLIEKFNTSFEEASNTFDEVNVMNILTDFKYDLSSKNSNYYFSYEFFSDLVDYMRKFDQNFQFNIIDKGISYLISTFSSYGVQVLNYFFDMCIEMNYRMNNGKVVDKNKLYETFYVLTESFNRKNLYEKYDFSCNMIKFEKID